MKSFDIMGHEINEWEISQADYKLDIESRDVGLLDVSKIDYMVNLGYTETKQYINKNFPEFYSAMEMMIIGNNKKSVWKQYYKIKKEDK